MISLNATKENVMVVISGDVTDIARELHALFECIKEDESMQEALMVALAVGAIAKEENLQSNEEVSDFFKYVFGKGNGNGNLKS